MFDDLVLDYARHSGVEIAQMGFLSREMEWWKGRLGRAHVKARSIQRALTALPYLDSAPSHSRFPFAAPPRLSATATRLPLGRVAVTACALALGYANE